MLLGKMLLKEYLVYDPLRHPSILAGKCFLLLEEFQIIRIPSDSLVQGLQIPLKLAQFQVFDYAERLAC
jgi:hypothetical protein